MKDEYDMAGAKRGVIIPVRGKTRVTLYLDSSILEHYRHEAEKCGKGYQTLINDALHGTIKNNTVSPTTLRRVIREELKKAMHR